ncbi:hypothetical protein LTR36_008650 [Oleoguttula mirabilis]|uniref:Calpain catalytic domain-containing protein n=1 Tax=Oleoguttula mirabilis TaxID=1507867 RepID=A0AAV9JTD5_9PEZI|nr:hypothetical protein LTR36_008650 [Oleoguttula mirabilis]
MADPDPPQPVPFPIRIVADPLPPLSADDGPAPPEVPSGRRNDHFYEAWEQFLAIEPKRAKTASTAAKKLEEERKAVKETPGDGLQLHENAATSWEQAAAECKAKVAAIVEECKRLNQKYRDAVFDLEANSDCLQALNGRYPKAIGKIDPPPWIKRIEDIFDEPQFFIDGATATDVHQGSGGDCWFLAALMAVSAKKELIESLCVARDERVGVYGFVFYRDGGWIYEVIDDKLFMRVGDDDDLQVVRDWDKDEKLGMSLKHENDKLRNQLQKGGEALYFSHCKSNETWLPLIEKAYAKAHGDYFAIEGGFASEGIEDLTGGVGVVLNPEDIMDKDLFWREQLSQVNEKYLFGGGSKPTGSKGFVGSHAYAVLEAWEEGDLKLLKLRNPWGEVEWDGDWSDGSKLWTAQMMTKLGHIFGDDGVFWISYMDFLKHFPSINRVRLLNSKDWQMAQQWTCVNVPWTVDYLDTKFQFTISEQGPVVVVLSQPDDRYFYGLRGRFLCSLHFRVYREGEREDEWIVRSMHNSGNESLFTRSVSAEIEDLKPGTYNVIFKVTATRSNSSSTAEESVVKYAIERKEKLLHVGRRFDYAQTKGNLRAMEEANKKQKKTEMRIRQNDAFRRARKINQQEKERARKRKQRTDEAMKEKRKAFEMARRQKNKQRRQRMPQRRENQSTAGQPYAGVEADSETNGDQATPTTESEAASPEKAGQESEHMEANTAADDVGDSSEKLSKDLSKLQLKDRQDSNGSGSRCVSPLEDEKYDSPLEAPEELDEDDFDWDSEIDGPVDSSDDEDSQVRRSLRSVKNEIFADDPWNALCVLGLRVYSLNSDASVCVVKSENGS